MSEQPQQKPLKRRLRQSANDENSEYSPSPHIQIPSQENLQQAQIKSPVLPKRNYANMRKCNWNKKQKIRYFVFTHYYSQIPYWSSELKSIPTYKSLSLFVKTRSPEQCKSYHLSVKRYYNNMDEVVQAMKKQLIDEQHFEKLKDRYQMQIIQYQQEHRLLLLYGLEEKPYFTKKLLEKAKQSGAKQFDQKFLKSQNPADIQAGNGLEQNYNPKINIKQLMRESNQQNEDKKVKRNRLSSKQTINNKDQDNPGNKGSISNRTRKNISETEKPQRISNDVKINQNVPPSFQNSNDQYKSHGNFPFIKKDISRQFNQSNQSIPPNYQIQQTNQLLMQRSHQPSIQQIPQHLHQSLQQSIPSTKTQLEQYHKRQKMMQQHYKKMISEQSFGRPVGYGNFMNPPSNYYGNNNGRMPQGFSPHQMRQFPIIGALNNPFCTGQNGFRNMSNISDNMGGSMLDNSQRIIPLENNMRSMSEMKRTMHEVAQNQLKRSQFRLNNENVIENNSKPHSSQSSIIQGKYPNYIQQRSHSINTFYTEFSWKQQPSNSYLPDNQSKLEKRKQVVKKCQFHFVRWLAATAELEKRKEKRQLQKLQASAQMQSRFPVPPSMNSMNPYLMNQAQMMQRSKHTGNFPFPS